MNVDVITLGNGVAGGADALAVFHDPLPGHHVPQGDLVAVGHVAVNGDDLGIALLVPDLHLRTVCNAVGEYGGDVVLVVHLQC